MTIDSFPSDGFLAALSDAGLPEGFSVARQPQVVPSGLIADIAGFIRVFDRVTGREAWRAAALSDAPPIAQARRREVCFFSAWDFHLPPEGGFQLIEFNDNGSGFLFASIINALFYDVAELEREKGIAPPASISAFRATIAGLVEREANAFFGRRPDGLVLVIDDAESLRNGKFRGEHGLICDLLGERGWRATIGSPSETRSDGERLTFDGQTVAFVVNRSTDFFWRSDAFAALRQAYASGGLYAAPNPFTYAVRSDKGLMAQLSSPDQDGALGIEADERRTLSAHVPETHVLNEGDADILAERKADFVFKPRRGFASRGLMDSAALGRARLRRLLRQGDSYVAQKRIAKAVVRAGGADLWMDLRVWAYRGEIVLLSGRASRRPDRLDLAPPGGWLPTYVSR
ncbi:MAG TPA: hypothetical protein VJY34_20530 [Roseiarcus sp.]|nr:hypothetical protein [Roseiarcus sp.]